MWISVELCALMIHIVVRIEKRYIWLLEKFMACSNNEFDELTIGLFHSNLNRGRLEKKIEESSQGKSGSSKRVSFCLHSSRSS